MSKTIQPDSRIRWHYKLFLADGHLVEASENPEGDILQLGRGEIHPNVEAALIGLEEGEQTRLILLASEAFGMPDKDAIQFLKRSDFPADMPLEEKQIISFTLPSGQEIPGKILHITDDTVQVDFNHPLAGHHISFELTIVAILD